MMKDFFECELRTDIGTRTEQQDYASVSRKQETLLAVLCDGMGGMCGGAAAARSAAETFVHGFETESIQHVPTFLIQKAEQANALVAAMPHSGTTIVSVIVTENKLYWLSVGDSRLYILRNDSLIQVTTDHNYFLLLKELYESGRITMETYMAKAAKGNALISYLGMPKLDRIDISVEPLTLQSGDALLLCSDGVYDVLHEEILQTQLQLPAADAADMLIELIRSSSLEQKDNATFILLKFN